MDYNYFTQEGTLYKAKIRNKSVFILIFSLLLFTVFSFYIQLWIAGVVMLSLAVFIYVADKQRKLEVDMQRREIHGKLAFGQPDFVIPIDTIKEFMLTSYKASVLVTATQISVSYSEDGQWKMLPIIQENKTVVVQSILEELKKIIQ